MYVGHLLANHQTSWVGTILVIFSTCITIGVAVYLYREFRLVKSRHVGPDLEEGETEFEIAPAVTRNGRMGKVVDEERSPLVRPSNDDDLFFDHEEH